MTIPEHMILIFIDFCFLFKDAFFSLHYRPALNNLISSESFLAAIFTLPTCFLCPISIEAVENKTRDKAYIGQLHNFFPSLDVK